MLGHFIKQKPPISEKCHGSKAGPESIFGDLYPSEPFFDDPRRTQGGIDVSCLFTFQNVLVLTAICLPILLTLAYVSSLPAFVNTNEPEL